VKLTRFAHPLHTPRVRQSGSNTSGVVPQNRQTGFSLLEVLVALTITGLALGSLFGVIAGNKRLAWRAEEALVKATQVRSLINFSQLEDDKGELEPELDNKQLQLNTDFEIDYPARKTNATKFALYGFEVLDDNGEVLARGSHWVELDLPQ
jgi:prepilin-type N-terminal cleavage/methylation domain-containing protein